MDFITKGCGIDYSYTSPAICMLSNDGSVLLYGVSPIKKLHGVVRHHNVTIIITPYPHWECQIERFHLLRDWAMDIITNHEPETVLMEGYAYAGTGNVFDIGEATGLLKSSYYQRYQKEIPVMAPSAIKKLVTGKGNAKKPDMVQAAERDLGLKFFDAYALKTEEAAYKSPFNDLSDAYHIARIAQKP